MVKPKINEYFFDTNKIITPEQAYVLGFFYVNASMNSLHNQISFKSFKNYSSYELISELIGYTEPIKPLQHNKTKTFISFSSKKIINDLNKFGITINRKINFKIPFEKINSNVLPYFMRALWEFNSSSFKTKSAPYGVINISTTSLPLKQQLNDYFGFKDYYNTSKTTNCSIKLRRGEGNCFLNYIYRNRLDLVNKEKFLFALEYMKKYKEDVNTHKRELIKQSLDYLKFGKFNNIDFVQKAGIRFVYNNSQKKLICKGIKNPIVASKVIEFVPEFKYNEKGLFIYKKKDIEKFLKRFNLNEDIFNKKD